VNGQLGASLGSPLAAAVVNNVLAVCLLLGFAAVSGRLARAVRNLRNPTRRRGLRPWHLLAGINGGLYLAVGAEAAVTVGVAIFSIALVFGQLVGGLISDRFGISPAGRRPFTAPRLLGVALGLTAVAIASAGAGGEIEPWVIVATVLIGGATGAQQAAMGHVTAATGEPTVAASINACGGIAIVLTIELAIAAVGDGLPPLDFAATSPPEWIGGFFAAGMLATVATVVGRLGLLVLALALVSGQTVGSLIVDLVAPASGGAVTAATVAGVVLAVAAMAATVIGGRPRARTAQTGAE